MKNITYSSTWQRLSFLSSLPLRVYSMTFSIQLGTQYYPINFNQKSWCNLWWPAWPSKSTLQRLLDLAGLRYTTSEKSGPSWQSMLRNFLSRPLSVSRLDYCNASSGWSSIKHNQTSTNDSECCGTTGLQWAQKNHVTPLFISLHWLPGAARIKFKTLMLAYRTTTGSAPSYFHSLLRIYIPSRSLRSASERPLWYHHREAQNHSPEHSHSPFLDGGIIFPPLSGMLDPCQSSSNNWRSSFFSALLDFP